MISKKLKELRRNDFCITGIYYSYESISTAEQKGYIEDVVQVIADIFYPKGKLTSDVILIYEGYVEEDCCSKVFKMTHPDIAGFELVYEITLAHSEDCDGGFMFPATSEGYGITLIGFKAGDLDVKCLSSGEKITDVAELALGLICTFHQDYEDFMLCVSEVCSACAADEDGLAEAEQWAHRYDFR